MKVHWDVEDGYGGKSRPQTTEVDDSDYLETPPEDREAYLEECVQEDFEGRITWFINEHTEPIGEDPYEEGGELYEEDE